MTQKFIHKNDVRSNGLRIICTACIIYFMIMYILNFDKIVLLILFIASIVLLVLYLIYGVDLKEVDDNV